MQIAALHLRIKHEVIFFELPFALFQLKTLQLLHRSAVLVLNIEERDFVLYLQTKVLMY